MDEFERHHIPEGVGAEWPGGVEWSEQSFISVKSADTESEWPGEVELSERSDESVWEPLPVGETRSKRKLRAVEAVKIALMYHHKRRHEMWEGLTGETISNLPPLAAVSYGGFTDPTIYSTVAEFFQHLSNPEQALLATVLISGTLGWKIQQNRAAEKKLSAVFLEYKNLFTGHTLPAAEKTRLEKELTDRLHRDFRLELEGLPDEIKEKDFDTDIFLKPLEKKFHDAIDEAGRQLSRTNADMANMIGDNLLRAAQKAGQSLSSIANVFKDTVSHVAYYAHPTKGFGPLVKDGFQNGVNAANLFLSSDQYTKHAFHYIKHFKGKSQDADKSSSEMDAVESAKGQAVISTLWIQCTVMLQSFFIYKEGQQGAAHLSSAFNNYSMGRSVEARADLLIAAVELFISAGFATKALQELFREFSYNHDQLESKRSRKVTSAAVQLLEKQDERHKIEAHYLEQLDSCDRDIRALRALVEKEMEEDVPTRTL